MKCSRVVRIKLKHYPNALAKRIELGKTYMELFSALDMPLPIVEENLKHIFAQFVIRAQHRSKLQSNLSMLCVPVPTSIHYPAIIPDQKGYRRFRGNDSLDVARKAAEEVLSIPFHLNLTHEQMIYIVTSIRNARLVLEGTAL